jgi:glutaredoxin
MASQPRLVLHVVPFSHPCLAVSAALDRLGHEYETVELVTGQQAEEVEKVYGEGRRTVPGLLPESMGTFAGVAQLGSSLHLLVQIGDVRPLVEERPAAKLLSLFEPGKGDVPAGAFPPGWVP